MVENGAEKVVEKVAEKVVEKKVKIFSRLLGSGWANSAVCYGFPCENLARVDAEILMRNEIIFSQALSQPSFSPRISSCGSVFRVAFATKK